MDKSVFDLWIKEKVEMLRLCPCIYALDIDFYLKAKMKPGISRLTIHAGIFDNWLKNSVEADNLTKINITYRYRYFDHPTKLLISTW